MSIHICILYVYMIYIIIYIYIYIHVYVYSICIYRFSGAQYLVQWSLFQTRMGLRCQGDLRNRLWKMNDFADQFIVLPSGVWNKIDAQV